MNWPIWLPMADNLASTNEARRGDKALADPSRYERCGGDGHNRQPITEHHWWLSPAIKLEGPHCLGPPQLVSSRTGNIEQVRLLSMDIGADGPRSRPRLPP
jgi:hypothetical protein